MTGTSPGPVAERETVRPRARRLTPKHVVLIALLAGLAVVGLRLASQGGNPTAFARFGDRHVDVQAAPDGAQVSPGTGYDGQYFYRIARDPTSRADRVDGVDLDRPAFRTRRIVYPTAAWLVSLGGRQALVPWAMIAVNIAALGALAGAVALIARDEFAPAWIGLVVAAWPGFLVALVSNLSELTAAALLAWALLALRRRRWLGAALLLTLALLTRESTALVALGVVGAAAGRHIQLARAGHLASAEDGPPAWVGVVPIATLGLWLALVDRWWSGRETDTQLGQTADQFGIPLLGPIRQIGTFLANVSDGVSTYQFLQFLIVLVVIGLGAAALRGPAFGRPHERVALIGALLAASMLITWDRAVVFLRYPDEIVLLIVVMAAGTAPVLLRILRRTVPALLLTALPVWITIS